MPKSTYIGPTAPSRYLYVTHSTSDEENINNWKRDWGGDIFMSHGSSNSRGVGILISPGVNYDLISEYTDEDGRVVILEVQGKENLIKQ